MKIRVESEVGRLRSVLVHRPGREIDRMMPSMMEKLLFDDILYGEGARREHDLFSAVLERAGVRVLYAQDLLAEVLGDGGEARGWLLGELERSFGAPSRLTGRLAELDPAALAEAAVAGLRSADAGGDPRLNGYRRTCK
jgi:arginine deiminase